MNRTIKQTPIQLKKIPGNPNAGFDRAKQLLHNPHNQRFLQRGTRLARIEQVSTNPEKFWVHQIELIDTHVEFCGVFCEVTTTTGTILKHRIPSKPRNQQPNPVKRFIPKGLAVCLALFWLFPELNVNCEALNKQTNTQTRRTS